MFPFLGHMNKQRVPAADDQRNIWLKFVEFGAGGFAANPGRIKVRFVMMNANEPLSQSKREGLRGLKSHQQRRRQTGPLGCCDRINVVGLQSSLSQSRARD